jgi:hypothetical protein
LKCVYEGVRWICGLDCNVGLCCRKRCIGMKRIIINLRRNV